MEKIQSNDVVHGLPDVERPAALKQFPACAFAPHGKRNDEHRFFVIAASSAEASRLAKEHANELSFSGAFLKSWEGELVLDGPMTA